MAFPYLSYGSSGVLAQPATITNPLEQQQQSPDAAGLAAMAEARARNTALQKALYRIKALQDQPGGGYAQGTGPLGIRQGVGRLGWMTSLGDAVAGVLSRKEQEGAHEDVTAAMGPLSDAEQAYIEEFLKSDGSQPRTGRSPMSYVPQGTPLMGMSDPLALKMKY